MELDTKRKKLELSRVRLAREELELKIEERLEEIERLKAHIEIQTKKEAELSKELN
jgi:hypothetical protein